MPQYSKMTEKQLCEILAKTKDRRVIEDITNQLVCNQQAKEDAQKAEENKTN